MELRKSNFDSRNYSYKRGQIINVELIKEARGSVQRGYRPCLVVQNDIGNKFSPTLIIIPITSQTGKRKLPTHIELDSAKYGLDRDSTVITEQIVTIDKSQCNSYIGKLEEEDMKRVERAILVSMGIAV